MFGDGTLDVRVHGEAQVRAQALEDRGDEKENQGEWKQTRQHRRVSEWVVCVSFDGVTIAFARGTEVVYSLLIYLECMTAHH